MLDWSKYPNFSEAEFRCRHTGKCHIEPSFLDALQALRTEYGRPVVITSGYRHPSHPVEAVKADPGAHSFGLAADISVRGADCHAMLKLAMAHGFTGIGIAQRGEVRFLHLDMMRPGGSLPRPNVWSY